MYQRVFYRKIACRVRSTSLKPRPMAWLAKQYFTFGPISQNNENIIPAYGETLPSEWTQITLTVPTDQNLQLHGACYPEYIHGGSCPQTQHDTILTYMDVPALDV